MVNLKLKGQGLPLNTIVLAALAIFVLLLVLGFSSGSLSKIFGGFNKQTSQINLDLAKQNCRTYCNDVKNQINLMEEPRLFSDVEKTFTSSNYCKKLESYGGNVAHCWEDPIDIECRVVTTVYEGGNYKRVECYADETQGGCICKET